MSMTFTWRSINEYRCTAIEDRNGNYMVINYDWRGNIENVTDTLGRVITFNYDTNANLSSITQSWNGVTHTWATFGWDNLTMQPSVTGVVGTYSGETIPVLKTVGFDDGSYAKFLYNGNGQVTRITRYASDSNPVTDSHPRNYTIFDYDSASNDCPRLTATRTWAEYWTGLNGVPTEVTTYFGVDSDSRVLTAPDGTVYKETYAGSADAAWMRGLVKNSEVWSSGVQQKVSTIAWTQDNTTVNYKTNPRVIERNVYDSSGNRRRTTIDFSRADYAQYGLPYFITEYAADGINELRRTYTDYNLNQAYLDRRIIGLVAAVHVTGPGGYQTKVTYGYDDPTKLSSQATTATMHDQNYDGLFIARGNATSVSRWDVTDVVNASKALTTTMNYNAAGSVLSTTDPAGHTSYVIYADSFSDGNNGRNTFAYPTRLTDADDFSSTLQYNFDFGSKTRVEGPPPQNQSNGIIQTFSYDTAARLEQVTMLNNGAYTHYEYGSNFIKTYTTVNNVAADYHFADLYTTQVFDGVGRAFTTTTNHPGSAGGYKLVNVIFDKMGRPFLQSNPTEVNSSWLPAGDDADGVHYSLLTFDWKGRTRRTTHQDGTYSEASYTGCGCAGSEVATLTDEMNRQSKVYSDVLGRSWKTEIMTWPDENNSRSIYSTTVSVYNARDQVVIANQYAGSTPAEASSTNTEVWCPSGSCQKTSISYDGYGRLQSRHVPEQDTGTATTWTYNPDNTLNSVTDARGTSATYDYNNSRRLVNHISYEPAGGAPDTPDVWFGYDAAENRTSMTDGLGVVSYSFDSLSRMVSETRTFSGVGSFTLSYDYNLSDDLKRITDATGMTINFGFDSIGRVSSVTGSDNLYAGVSNYATNFQYRAWGGLKAVTSGSGHTSSLLYNVRLRPSQFDINSNVVHQSYDYYADGKISFVHNSPDINFDRAYFYDHTGRLVENKTGGDARGDTGDMPYHETFGFDAFSNLTGRNSDTWNYTDSVSDFASYTNNRRGGWGYDVDGRNTAIGTRSYSFDADGQMTLMTGQKWVVNHYVPTSQTIFYDGDGDRAKETLDGTTTYYLKSTVLDEIVEEIDAYGQKTVGYVRYPEGELLARQAFGNVAWQQMTTAGTSRYETYVVNSNYARVEFDSVGADIPLYAPPVRDTNGQDGDIGGNHSGGIMDSRWANFFDVSGGCPSTGYTAACHGVMSPDQYLEAKSRSFFGDRWYDLPGNNNEIARAESAYVAMVQRTIEAHNAAKTPKTKPKLKPQKPRKPLTPEQRRKAEERRRRDARKGKMDEGPGGGVATDPVPGTIPTVEHFVADQEKEVRSAFDKLFSDPCSQAFRAAGLKTPLEVAKQGLVIRPSTDLINHSAAELNLVSEATRDAYRNEFFGGSGGQAGTIPATRNGVSLTTDGRTQIYLDPVWAFSGESWVDRTFSFQDVMSHEFIHAGGQRPQPGWLGRLRHDLAGFGPHDTILAACR